MPLIALDLDGTLVDQAAAARAWSAGFVDHWRLPAGEVDVVAAALTARRPKGEVFSELIDRLDLQHRLTASGPTTARGYRRS